MLSWQIIWKQMSERVSLLTGGAICHLFWLKRLVNAAAALHIQVHREEIPMLKLHISVICYLHNIFTNIND